jgi:hypothetical protein
MMERNGMMDLVKKIEEKRGEQIGQAGRAYEAFDALPIQSEFTVSEFVELSGSSRWACDNVIKNKLARGSLEVVDKKGGREGRPTKIYKKVV